MFSSRNKGRSRNYRQQTMPGFSRNKTIKGKRKDSWKIFLWIMFIVVGIPFVVGGSWFYKNILKDLPDISEIENFNFKQATTITDKNGEELYTLFEENRQYIGYEKISLNFINGLVATEDQRFWTNPGIDLIGTIRAGITDVTKGKIHGASTLTQQLIKNLMLTPEKRIERKMKEIVLALKLNRYISTEIKKKFRGLSADDVEKKMKEKILELYSNYIFLGNNSYGIEVASKSYFNKSAADLNVLEGAILAGIPQAPSTYDPYNNREALMGEVLVSDINGNSVEVTDVLYQKIVEKVKTSILGVDIAFKRDDNVIIEYFKGLLSFQIKYEGNKYQVKYNVGRKDTVLARMYEEGYITEGQFKQSFLEGFTYKFQRGKVEIKAPHFVFWVIKKLEESYDAKLLRKGGLTIKTSLDYNIQKLAEQSILENEKLMNSYQVGNAAMLYVNSQDGDVLAYVGSRDFYNKEIDGEVDLVQAKRQPGSIIKPFIYAFGFMNVALTIDSPIYDLPLTIGKKKPENSDGNFKGLMSIKNALAASRNIPAIKMFFAAGGEDAINPFLKSIGLKNLKFNLGYSLALGAGEVPMIEMVNGYMHLSAMGKPAKINPILEIRASDGSLLYKKQVKTQKEVIPAGVAYLLRNILSTKTNFPESWQKNFTYPGISFATKSGTTNIKKGKENLPRDAWFAAYTPSDVMVFWGGNTNGNALKKDAYGGWVSGPLWKIFTKKLEENGFIQNISVQEREVQSVSISKLSGKIANYKTPLAFMKKSIGYIKSLPIEVDKNIRRIQIDKLCGGKPTELTPKSEIQEAYFITPQTIMPDKRDQGKIVDRWRNFGASLFGKKAGLRVYVDMPTKTCEERYKIKEFGKININIKQPKPGSIISRNFSLFHQTKSPFKIKYIKLYLNDIALTTLNYSKQEVTEITNVTIPKTINAGGYKLKVVVTDEKGYTDSKTIAVTLIDSDITPPYLLRSKLRIKKQNNGSYEVVLLFADNASTITSGTIRQGGKVVHKIKSNVSIFNVSTGGVLSYEVSDSAGNMATGTVTIHDREEKKDNKNIEKKIKKEKKKKEKTQKNTKNGD